MSNIHFYYIIRMLWLKEMAKLKEQLDEKEAYFQEERSGHVKEKNELVIKWQKDSEKHYKMSSQSFSNFSQ